MSDPGPSRADAAAGAWEEAAAAGIHRLAIPTPFMVGRVNTYLIEDDPLTLVDSGPNSAKALDELERGLAGLGHAIEELELLVVTHQHIDHTGLIESLRRRTDAEVVALDQLADVLDDYRNVARDEDAFGEVLMLRHGVPSDIVVALRAVSAAFRAWGSSATVDRRLQDGGTLALAGRTLTVAHRPGHSPTDTTFWDADRRILIAADHLIAHISSNPLMSPPPGWHRGDDPTVADRDRPPALMRYLESLRRTRELPAQLVLTGHGEPVVDHRTLIDERLAMHERRAERMLDQLRGEPRTAYEIATELWGNVAVTQAFLTLSEVLGHLDLLRDDGRVEPVEDADAKTVRFSAAR